MADTNTTVHIGENSPEQVAYRLLQDVMNAEGRSIFRTEKREQVDRKYLLDTYVECLKAVKATGHRKVD
jgi:hypothetical protein